MTKRKRPSELGKGIKRRSDPDLFSVNGAAIALNRATRTVAKALRDVPPAERRSGLKLWRMKDIVAAINANTHAPIGDGVAAGAGGAVSSGAMAKYGELAAERARLAHAKAQREELELGRLLGKYALVDDMIKVVARDYAVVREQMLSLAEIIADSLTPHCAEDRAIDGRVREVLENLSSPRVHAGQDGWR